MMKFLPVAALTASAICVMSASLKFGVMRCACCADASEAASMTASASNANELIRAIGNTSPTKTGRRPGLRAAAVAALRFRGRRHGPGLRLRGQRIGFLRHLRYVQSQILLLTAANDRDARLTGASQGAQNLLAAVAIVQRRAVDGGHLIPGPQPEPGKSLAVAPRVDPKAVH